MQAGLGCSVGARATTSGCRGGRHCCASATKQEVRGLAGAHSPVAGVGAGGSFDFRAGKKSGSSTRDITIASRGGRGQGGISEEIGAALPSFLLFPPSLDRKSVV